MLTEITSSRPIAAGVVHWPDGHATLVVKLTLELRAEGDTFRLVPDASAEPLSLDAFDASGVLVYPSDFAPFKPSCDVVILSEVDRAAAGELVVGALRRELPPFDAAGARETFCPGGDPTDPAALPLWGVSGGDFTRLQVAPPHQRMPFPTTSLAVAVRRGGAQLRGVLDPPRLRFSFAGRGSDPVARITPQLDFIGLRPDRSRAVLVYRAVCDRSRAREDSVAVSVDEASGSTAGAPAAIASASTWLRSKLLRPADVAQAARSTARSTARLPPPEPVERTRMVDGAFSPKETFPFEGAAPSPEARSPFSPEEFAELRHRARVPAPSFDTREETQVIEWAREGARDREVPAAPPTFEDADTHAAADEDDIDPERAAAVNKELWAGRERLAAILARHGISEEAWRRHRARKR